MKLTEKKLEKLCWIERDTYDMFPAYVYKNHNMYGKMTDKLAKILVYINLLASNGFVVHFFPWDAAVKHGVLFQQPVSNELFDKLNKNVLVNNKCPLSKLV